jgi:dihydropteroate synthase
VRRDRDFAPASLILVHRLGSWDLSERARVVGILNLTPDSFFDGGRWNDRAHAVAHAEAMARDGADAIDVGGQSTRPDAGAPLSAEEEWSRVAPVLPELVRLGLPVSIDTYRAEVARRALDAGAAMVNDVSGLTAEPVLALEVAQAGAALVLMHSLGAPGRMHDPVAYGDISIEVRDALEGRMNVAIEAGVPRERIALDPGLGFSKRAEQSLEVLRGLPLLAELGRPLYVGLSRKSFLGQVTGRAVEDRLAASLGATIAAFALGARIIRTHDVRETVDALRAAEAILNRAPSLRAPSQEVASAAAASSIAGSPPAPVRG